jgi:hypothetical protein
MKPSSDTARRPIESPLRPQLTLLGAATEVFSAGQQLLLDRVDLLQAEVTSDVKRLSIAAGLFGVASAIVLLGWTLLTAALAVLLARLLPLDAALALAGGGNVLLGVLFGALGYRRMLQPTAFDRPAPASEITHA